MANIWRGERIITAVDGDGAVIASATLAATHAHLAQAMDAAGEKTMQGLLEALHAINPVTLAKVAGAFEAVDGDPAAVIAAARGAIGLDMIADALVGLVKGQTEEEQVLEKKQYSDQRFAAQAAVMQSALEPLIGTIATLAAEKLKSPPEKDPSAS